MIQETLVHDTPGRGSYDITGPLQQIVQRTGVTTGLCHLFIQHTSASLLVCENADAQVRRDLERFLARLVPDGDPLFGHVDEGPDDMPAHIRSIITRTDMTLPIREGRCALGTWQGIFLYEHRHRPQRRRILVTLFG